MNDQVLNILEKAEEWAPPALPEEIPHGDAPGEKIRIYEPHVIKANVIFPELLKLMKPVMIKNNCEKAVVTVCGGSGVGKTAVASLLSYYFQQTGIGSYTLSGDNYPRRIPRYNDAERLHIFREHALKGMIKEGTYTSQRFARIQSWQKEGTDADPSHIQQYSWFASYLYNGKKGLEGYLGTEHEIDFHEVTEIIRQFKKGEKNIWLKRMGRTEEALWYEQVDFSDINVLIIEWTHGNSDYFEGVDIPILLNSTPQETLECRRARNRDADTDSSFTTMVLEIEQEQIKSQAHKAGIILSRQGKLLSYREYLRLMGGGSPAAECYGAVKLNFGGINEREMAL